MKILHIVHGYYPALGGAERLMQRVSENLVSQYQDSVTVFTANGYNNEAFTDASQPTVPTGTSQLNGVTVERFPVFNRLGKPLYHLQNVAYQLNLPGNQYVRTLYNGPILPKLGKRIAAFEADVIAAASFPLLHMFTTQRASKRAGKPHVLIGALHPLNEWGFQRPMIYEAIRQAEAYIALSAYEKAYLVEQWGINGRKVHVIGSGVNVERFEQANRHTFRQQYGLTNEPLIGYIGQHGTNKGIDTLLYAMKSVWATFPDARLLIAGAKTQFTATLQRIIARELTAVQQANIIQIENFSEEEKPALFAACDIFAYPSAFESFGIAYIEAWSAKKPVIGCYAGAVPTVIEENVDGLLIPVKDADALAKNLLFLLENESARIEMGQAGYEKVKSRYSWQKVTAKWRAVYEEVL